MELEAVSSSGKTIGRIKVQKSSTIQDVKSEVQKIKKNLYPERQSIKLDPKGRSLKDSDVLQSLDVKNGSKIYIKDLGPQIGWSTVFLCEYAGPLFTYLIFYPRPSLIYGAAASTQKYDQVVHIAAACWTIHYAKRILETLFIHRFSHATMPIMNLFKNCAYYWGFAAFVSYFINHPLYTAPCCIQVYAGLAAFTICELGNLSIHIALRNLRPPGTSVRRIPYPTGNPLTQLFNLVSCPNYTYEIGSWIAFSIMAQSAPGFHVPISCAFCLLLFVFSEKHPRKSKSSKKAIIISKQEHLDKKKDDEKDTFKRGTSRYPSKPSSKNDITSEISRKNGNEDNYEQKNERQNDINDILQGLFKMIGMESKNISILSPTNFQSRSSLERSSENDKTSGISTIRSDKNDNKTKRQKHNDDVLQETHEMIENTSDEIYKKVGRKAAIPFSFIHLELKKFAADVRDGFNRPSAVIWSHLSKKLHYSMTSKGLYTYVRKNKNNCWALLNFDFAKTMPKYVSHDESSSESSDSYDVSISIPKHKLTPFELKEYVSGRKRYSFPPGWTHDVDEKLRIDTSLLCIWSFKSHYVHPFTNTASIHLICKECPAEMELKCSDLEKEEFSFKGFLRNYVEEKHSGLKKRHLTGKQRQEIGTLLANGVLPSVWRKREVIRQGMKMGDEEPRNLYGLDVLCKAKQEVSEKEGFKNVKCPIKNLERMYYDSKYAMALQYLSVIPFQVHYCLKEQKEAYEDYVKKDSVPTIVFDATGSLVQKIIRPNDTLSGNIFLFCGIIQGKIYDGFVPVVQMLSEKHNMSAIEFWLREWLQSVNNRTPKVVTFDHSLAFIGAAVRAFTSLRDTRSYSDRCMKVLKKELKKTQLPETYIRVDFAHVMKFLSCWDCFKNTTSLLKEFYFRSCERLISTSSIDEAENICKALFLICSNQFESVVVNESKSFLQALISKQNVIIMDEDLIEKNAQDREEYEIDNQELIYIETNDDSTLNGWIFKLLEESKATAASVEASNNPSYYFLPGFAENLKRFLRTFPFWSCVLCSEFGVATKTSTSAVIEGYFNDLKNRTFSGTKLPIRVDKFVDHHFTDLFSTLVLNANSQTKNSTPDIIKEEKSAPLDAENIIKDDSPEGSSNVLLISDEEPAEADELATENWKGLGNKSGGKRRNKRTSRYRAPFPEIKLLSEEWTKKAKIFFLRNGNNFRTVTISGSKYIIKNTCGFDSFLTGVAIAYCDSPSYKAFLDTEKPPFLKLIIKITTSSKLSREIYKIRAEMLLEFFEDVVQQTVSDFFSLDCNSNIMYNVEKVMKDVPSAITSVICPKCEDSAKNLRNVIIMPINIEIVKEKGFSSLQEALNDCLDIESSRKCSCGHSLQLHYSFKKHLIFETQNCGQCHLYNLPICLTAGSTTYTLRAAVQRIGLENIDSIGHYINYSRRLDGKWERYDDTSKREEDAKSSAFIMPQCLLYTI